MSTRRNAAPCFCLASILLLLLMAGCVSSAARMYSGPARPRGEVARLDAGSFDVAQVDGTAIEERVRFVEFLPGCHSIGVVLDWREGRQVPQGSSGGMTVYGHLEQTIAFEARAGEAASQPDRAIKAKAIKRYTLRIPYAFLWLVRLRGLALASPQNPDAFMAMDRMWQ